ncbi:MAG: YbaN family protein [Pontibacterium sp.]
MWQRSFYYVMGYLALALGAIGVVLPLLPTTPFVLVAAFCFSKASPRLHRWLTNHRLFGPLICEWEAHGVIRFRIKCLATFMIAISISYPLFFKDFSIVLKALAIMLVSVGLAYIWTRPSEPKPASSPPVVAQSSSDD